ncbi:hypothetical protein L2E82_22879 [Cichorium intybus]|uniref:Uncharacterized protein n=1 Tax=Cichorium intybus TaxID=13427 RepID=A0ACB9DZN5_CICIN|nr:hypothetical protein L2E82_22879 [Cichorium intybus]
MRVSIGKSRLLMLRQIRFFLIFSFSHTHTHTHTSPKILIGKSPNLSARICEELFVEVTMAVEDFYYLKFTS